MQGSIDFERATSGLKTKSDKIRALSRLGVPTAEIARHLDIRYQHARNVLVEAGMHKVADPGAPPVAAPVPKSAWVELSDDGSLSIPAALIANAGVGPGPVHVRLTDDGIELFSRKTALARLQALAAPLKRAGVSEVDEFIAQRRREFENE